MSKTPKYDEKVKTILDTLVPGERTCSMTGRKWKMTEEEISWYKKFNVPPSKVAPQVRWMHHGLWYVGYQYWYQKHPETGKPVICTVHPATGIKVLPDKEWFAKDFSSEGRDYQVDQSFFEQWRKLQLSVPTPANRNHVEPTNSIAFVSQGDQDSYFVGACKTKNCLYSHVAINSERSAEMYQADAVFDSYHVVHSARIHKSRFIRDSYDCLNCAFLFDCRNCEFCFGATNKRNKKYLWMNEQLSQEEWEARYKAIDFGSRQATEEQKQEFEALIARDAVWPENFNEQAENSSGEYLYKTTNVKQSYFCQPGALDQYWCNFSGGQSEQGAFAGYAINGSEFYYAASGSGKSQKFCFLTIRSDEMEYCLLCYNCRNCFGCVGLQRKEFCIFNKQYSEEEYWQRVDELKAAMLDRGEYGEFLPGAYSPSYYADSGGMSWFGATEEDMKGMGALKFDPESEGAIGSDLESATSPVPTSQVPDLVDDLTDEWINKPLFDEVVNRRFAYIKPEVEFYRQLRIAPPTKHFTARIKDLWALANQGCFLQKRCDYCGKEITYAQNAAYPNRKVYCKEDYINFIEQNG